MSHWTTEPIFDSLSLIGLVATGIALATVFIGPSSETLSPQRRRTLVALRLLAVFVLFLTLLRPSLVHTEEQPAPATLAVLLDGSRSMTLPSGGDGSRWDVQRQVWASIDQMLKQRDSTLQVAVYQYDSSLRPLDLETEVAPFLSGQPEGDGTDLAACLRDSLSRAAGGPLAGIVLVGDGTQTVAIDSSGPQAIAQSLAALEVPLWTVPIGPTSDAGAARDIAIDGMNDQFQVFTKNLFSVSAQLRTRGFENVVIPVRLQLTDPEGKTQELARRDIVAGSDDDEQVISIEVPAPAPGNYRLEMIADTQPREVLADNNVQVGFLNVRDGGGRVLYLEGELRNEQVFLRRSIAAAADFEMSFEWIEPPGRNRTWPVDVGVAFSPDRYDVYILGDLDADALGNEQLSLLAERVNDGAGLLLIGGFQSFEAGGYGDSPLADAIPVKLAGGAKQKLGAAPDKKFHLEGPLPIRIARPHPINQIFSGSDQQALWSKLKPLKGANRLPPAKALPGVQVLLETPASEPMLVVGDYGKGRVVAFAGDTTWQWYRQGQAEAHRRFWRQTLLWLMRRNSTPPNQVAISLDERRFSSETEVSFTAEVPSVDGETLEVNLVAEIVSADNTVTAVAITRQEDDKIRRFSGKLQGLPDGIYRLIVRDKNPASGIDPGEQAFQVISIDRELSRPIADIGQMQQLAELTSEVGGRSVSPGRIESLQELITENRNRAVTPIVSKWRLGDEPVGGWIVLALFTGLLGTDWVLRKRWGMV